MVKREMLLMISVIVILLLIGCAEAPMSSIRISKKQIYFTDSGVLYKPVVADLEIISQERITGNATGIGTNNIAAIQNLAVANARQKVGADVLIDADFDTKITGDRVTVVVTGYPARFKNMRTITSEDYEWIDRLDKLTPAKVNEIE